MELWALAHVARHRDMNVTKRAHAQERLCGYGAVILLDIPDRFLPSHVSYWRHAFVLIGFSLTTSQVWFRIIRICSYARCDATDCSDLCLGQR